jgi:hypothetical protein
MRRLTIRDNLDTRDKARDGSQICIWCVGGNLFNRQAT